MQIPTKINEYIDKEYKKLNITKKEFITNIIFKQLDYFSQQIGNEKLFNDLLKVCDYVYNEKSINVEYQKSNTLNSKYQKIKDYYNIKNKDKFLRGILVNYFLITTEVDISDSISNNKSTYSMIENKNSIVVRENKKPKDNTNIKERVNNLKKEIKELKEIYDNLKEVFND